MTRQTLAWALLGVLLASATPAKAWDPFRTSQGDVDDGISLLKSGHSADALQAFEAAREEIPERAELHYDLGVAQFASKDYGQAVKAFERALERVEGPARADVLYALGTAYAAWALEAEKDPKSGDLAKGRWAEAVTYLERALRMRPEHEGALRNLEMALMRVDPPCGARDDDYEPNDSSDTAKKLEFPEGKQELDIPLKLCPDDEDWFIVPMVHGDRLFAEVTTDSEDAKLGLRLLEPDGETQLRPPVDSPDSVTTIVYQEGEAEGDMLLRVENVADEEADYHIKVTVLPSCERLEDGFEDNDASGQAHLVVKEDEKKLEALRVCPADDDWFAVDVGEGESLVAIASFQKVEKGTPSVAIADAGGNILAERTLPAATAPSGDAEGQVSSGDEGGDKTPPLVLTLLDPPAGRYLVRVSGTLDVEAGYGLQLEVVPPCPAGDDEAEADEGDDSWSTAKPVEPGKPSLRRICPGDEDWVSVKSSKEKPLVVTASFDHARGDLMMGLYKDDAEELLKESDVSTDAAGAEGFSLPPNEEETPFRVRIAGKPGQQNFYVLQVSSPEGKPGGEDDKKDQQKKDDKKQDQKKQDQKKRDQKKQDQKKQEQKKQDPKKQEQKKQDPMEQEMDQLDRNPRNLEAERVRQGKTYQRTRPTKPW